MPTPAMRRAAALAGRLSGALAVVSGAAYIVYVLAPADLRDATIVAWNLTIIPAAVWLGWLLRRPRPAVAALSTLAGVVASVLWAIAFRRPGLEPWWIGLAAVWWVGIGLEVLPMRRRLGLFTLALGVASAADFVLTALNAPMPIYALGGFKIPMTSIWSVWVGLAVLRDPTLSGDSRASERELGQT